MPAALSLATTVHCPELYGPLLCYYFLYIHLLCQISSIERHITITRPTMPSTHPTSQAAGNNNEPSGRQAAHNIAPTPSDALRATQVPLPRHWEELADADGKTFYANHASRTTSLQRPGVKDDASSLRAGWQALVDTEGRPYYVDHASRTTTFTKPWSDGETGDLPPGWEMLRTPEGVVYFVNHEARETTWDHPRHAPA